MSIELLKKWSAQAWALEGPVEALRAPFHVLAAEAVDVAHFAQQYWDQGVDDAGNIVRPGLSSATGARFTDGMSQEILELHDALQTAQVKYRLAAKTTQVAPLGRAQFAIREMHRVLRWYFDDERDTDGDAQLENIVREHRTAASHDALAAALFDYAALAELHRTAIAGLGGFDPALIDEAPKIAMALRWGSPGPVALESLPDPRQALELRNRIGMLLYDRMQRVRSAAQFVFRGHPDIIRRATSAYGRQQRAGHRGRKGEGAVETAEAAHIPAVKPAEPVSSESPSIGSTGIGLPGSDPFVN